MSELRIISLLPSATEIVCELGLRRLLVGRSHDCDFPPGIEELPVCSRPRYRSDGTSLDINREVLNVLNEALSIYRIDVERITSLRPTHILTQSLCAVCAVSVDEIRNALVECLQLPNVDYIDLNPETGEDVIASIVQVGAALGVPAEGERISAGMRSRFEAVRATAGRAASKPSVAYIEWIEPMMTAAHWIGEFIPMAGGVDVFSDAAAPWVDFDQLRARDPEAIVIAPCGFRIDKALENMHFLTDRPGWEGLRAVRNRRVYVCDGSNYFSRPGPRLADSLEILAAIIHPDLFPPVHLGSGWAPFAPEHAARQAR